ncbi:site-specific integrase [Agarivorans sp. 1_MG-2023]|uniref:site-specific integrase n=1 Tax=Agarivorans sp. 1_MG-2023 TaxID=3062634 RepID=UPI0026E12245|nr:site-specific integrase [Agarivorans sp. 1_MG-2023]MDO6763699.1 site-specific integrase [Agarivorans sp. 1_MG-2023]
MAITGKIGTSTLKALSPADKRINDTEIKGFHARISSSGAINYYLYYRINGKQVNYLLGKAGHISPVQARDLAKQKVGEVAAGKDVQLEKQVLKRKAAAEKFTRFATYVENKYHPWLVTNNTRTANQIKNVLLKNFASFADKQLVDISAWDVEKWRSERKKQGASMATINYNVNTLKGALSRAVDWGIIEAHELSKVKAYKLDNSRVRYLNDDEEALLLGALRQRDKNTKAKRNSGNAFREQRGYEPLPSLDNYRFADHIEPIVLIAMNTGMRRGEILGLKWTDIDLNIPSLTIRGEAAKSGKTRHIPLNPTVQQVIQDWRKQTTSKLYVFEGEEGKALTDIKKGWAKVVELAELEDFNFHDLRHHFASKLVMKSVDLNTVRELLGHADMNMTLRYAHLAPEHKAAAVNLL